MADLDAQFADLAKNVTAAASKGRKFNAATDFGGNTLQVDPLIEHLWGGNYALNTHLPIGQGVQNFLAGAGKATADLVRGAGQLVGLESRQNVADSRKLDADLMNTGAGKAGFITGVGADLLPTASIPGAGTFLGAAKIGAATGLLQPSTSTGETVRNTLLGGAAAPASVLAGRGLGALYNAGKSVVEPFLRGGQQRIAARTLQAFAGGPEDAQVAASRLQNAPTVLPGVEPTAAELADNAGISQLERSARNNPELTTAFNERDQSNRAAMTSALDDIAGTDAKRAAAVAAREKASAPLYQAGRVATAPADDTLRALLGRPSMQSAWARAQKLASENGDELVAGKDVPEHVIDSKVLDESGKPFQMTVPAQSSQYSGKALQYLKMALSDMANEGPQQGIGAHEQRAVKTTLGALNNWIREKVPALKAADEAFATGSVPINQMDVGRELRNRLVPALGDYGNNTRLSAASYANALRNGDDIAANVTGFENAKLAKVLSPQQMSTVQQVAQQLARRANAAEQGRAAGSNTAQNLVSQNVIRQILGPLGLPQTLGERAAQSALGQSIMRPVQFASKMGEPKVMQEVGRALLDPQYAAQLLMRSPSSKAARIVWARQGLLGSLGSSGPAGLLGASVSDLPQQ